MLTRVLIFFRGAGKTWVTDEERNIVWRSWKSMGQAEALDRFARESSPPIHMTAQFAGTPAEPRLITEDHEYRVRYPEYRHEGSHTY
jgi:hypothetical protein